MDRSAIGMNGYFATVAKFLNGQNHMRIHNPIKGVVQMHQFIAYIGLQWVA